MKIHAAIVDITNSTGELVESIWLARAERVNPQLRLALSEDYQEQMKRIFSDGGRMCAATQDEKEAITGASLWA